MPTHGGNRARESDARHHRTSLFGLINGGTAGLIWGYLFVWVGYMLVFASIAEMASMYVAEARLHGLGTRETLC